MPREILVEPARRSTPQMPKESEFLHRSQHLTATHGLTGRDLYSAQLIDPANRGSLKRKRPPENSN